MMLNLDGVVAKAFACYARMNPFAMRQSTVINRWYWSSKAAVAVALSLGHVLCGDRYAQHWFLLEASSQIF
jgi:hypothetical protein